MDGLQVVFSEVSHGFWARAAVRMSNHYGWRPIYWMGPADPAGRYANRLRARFPEVVYHDRFAAARNNWPAEFDHRDETPLDASLLRKLAPETLIALRMLDRMDIDGSTFPYDDRIRHVHGLMGRWLTFLERFEPDVIVFQEPPGFVSEYLLLVLAQCMGCQAVLFHSTAVPTYVRPAGSLSAHSDRLRELTEEVLASDSNPPLSAHMSRAYEAIRADLETAEQYVRRYFGAQVEEHSMRRIVRAARDGLRTAIHAVDPVTPARVSWHKLSGRPIEDYPSRARLQSILRSSRSRQVALKSVCQGLAVQPDLNSEYVYVALHYQPEVTTSPLAGMYVDQQHIVRLIAECVPDGWDVIVKEHPATFQPGSQGAQSRSERYYQELANIPKVTLASVDTASLTLVDNAQAVATATGTVGWEAVCRGVPVLAFGNAWYVDCPGVHNVRTIAEVSKAMRSIEAGERPVQRKVRAFLVALDRVAFPAYTNAAYADLPEIQDRDNADGLVAALVEQVGSRPE